MVTSSHDHQMIELVLVFLLQDIMLKISEAWALVLILTFLPGWK